MSMTKIATLKANISNFTSNLKQAAKAAEGFKKQAEQASNQDMTKTYEGWKRTGEQIENASKSIAVVSGAITAAGTALVGFSVSVASSFEDAFAEFRKVTEATESEFKSINKELKNLTKRMPATYEEIAEAAATASRLGVAKEYVVDFAEAAVMMGTATNMSSEDAAESMARFSNIVGTSLGDVHNLGSAVVDLGNNFAASESEIMTMGLRLAAAGKSAGMSEGDILGLAAAMTSLGLRAEMGGTAMSQILNRIGSDLAHNGDEAQAWASRAGMSVSEFRSAFEKDAVGALLALMKGLDDAVASGENLDIMLGELGINNIRQIDTMKRLVSGYDLLVEGQNRGNKAFAEGTALAEEAEQRYATFSSQVQILKNRFRLLTEVIGGVFMDVLSGLIKLINPVLDVFIDFVTWLSETHRWVLQVGAVLTLLGIAFFGVLTALAAVGIGFSVAMKGWSELNRLLLGVNEVLKGGLISNIGKLAKSLWDLSVVKTIVNKPLRILSSKISGLNVILPGTSKAVGILGTAFKFIVKRIVPVVAIIGVLATIIHYLWDTNEDFRNAVIKVWESIKSAYERTIGWLSDAFDSLIPVFERLGDILGDALAVALEFVLELFGKLGDLASSLAGYIEGLIPVIVDVGNALLDDLANGLEVVAELFDIVVSYIGDFIDYLGELEFPTDKMSDMSGVLERVVFTLLKLFGPIGWILEGFYRLATETTALSDAMDFLSGNMSLADFLDGLVESVEQVVSSMVDSSIQMIEVGASIIEKLAEGISKYLPIVVEKATEVIIRFIEGVVAGLPMVIATATEIITTMTETILNLIPVIIEIATTIISTLVETIITLIPMIVDVAINIVNTLLNTIITLLPEILLVGIDILTTLIGGIVDALPLLVDTIVSILETFITVITELLPVIVDVGLELIKALIEGIISTIPDLIEAGITLISTLLETIVEALPLIIDAGIQILFAIVEGILQVVTVLIDTAGDLILTLVDVIIDMLPVVLDAGLQILMALLEGIVQLVPQLIIAGGNLVVQLVLAILKALPKILAAGLKLTWTLVKGIVQIAFELGKAALKLITAFVRGIRDKWNAVKDAGKKVAEKAKDGVESVKGKMKDAGKNISGSIADGISAAKDKVTGAISSVTQSIRNFLPFSPAKEGALRDIMDVKIAESIAESIRNGSGTAINAMSNLASSLMDETDNVDFAGRIARTNAQVRSAVSHELSDDRNQVEKKPAYVTVVIGGREYRRFVEDITKEQEWIAGT